MPLRPTFVEATIYREETKHEEEEHSVDQTNDLIAHHHQ